MHFLIICILATPALAFPQGYGALTQTSGSYGQNCGPNEILHVDGRCVQPIVNRNIFLFAAPENQPVYAPPPKIPEPKIDYNIVFVRTPDVNEDQEPIIVPPPQQKTVVYVLNKEHDIKGQEVIEVPAITEKPEVFYVNFKDGENFPLPGGIDIKTALANANSQQGQVIGGTYGGGASFNGGTGFGGGSLGGHQNKIYK